MPRTTGDDAPGDAGKIFVDPVYMQPVEIQKGGDRPGLTRSDFDGDHASVVNESRRDLGDPSVRPHAVRPAVEGPPGIVTSDFGRQGR